MESLYVQLDNLFAKPPDQTDIESVLVKISEYLQSPSFPWEDIQYAEEDFNCINLTRVRFQLHRGHRTILSLVLNEEQRTVNEAKSCDQYILVLNTVIELKMMSERPFDNHRTLELNYEGPELALLLQLAPQLGTKVKVHSATAASLFFPEESGAKVKDHLERALGKEGKLYYPWVIYSQSDDLNDDKPNKVSNKKMVCVNKNILEKGRFVHILHDYISTKKVLKKGLSLEVLVTRGHLTKYYWQNSSYVPKEVCGFPKRTCEVEPERLKEYIYQLKGIGKAQSFYSHARIGGLFGEVLDNKRRELDEVLGGMRLYPRHSSLVFDIGLAIVMLLKYGGGLYREGKTETVYNNGVRDLVMWRYTLYDTPNVNIRLHLFPSAAETYLHNHSSDFISMCLFGKYTHSSYLINSEKDDTYYEQRRQHGGGLREPELRGGYISKSDSFVHSVGNVYFLSSSSFHLITTEKITDGKPEPDTASVLTLYVKDKKVSGETKVLTPAGKSKEDLPVDGKIINRTGEEREVILRAMEEKIKQFKTNLND